MHLLTGAEKTYDWGSPTAIQELTAMGRSGEPLAELWFGDHAAGPTRLDDGRVLSDVIRLEPEGILGREHRLVHGDRLPFLLKLLAPGRAVSLQVHPDPARAAALYGRIRNGDIRDGERRPSYVDPHHKPEMLLSLTHFSGLVGFRLPEEIHEILNLIDSPALEPAAASLDGTDHGTSRAFARLGALTTREVEDLTAEIRARIHLHEAFRTVSELALYYPGDPGVILSMMLRRHDLAPGEAIFVASGVPHAYLNGLAVEIMASSDNVFRAGLTTKSVDLDECVANLITRPAERFASSDHVGLFAPPVAEFALLVLHPDTRAVLEPGGPRMVLVTEGTATITTGNDTRLVERGQCVLIRHDDGAATVDSRGMAVVASTSATVTVTHGAGG